ncbi:MAG: hypothetical protein OHK0039_16390 [Bacteroidia bacterium]
MARSLTLSLLLLVLVVQVQAQRGRNNLGIDLGYQVSYFNPRPYNFAIDSLYNTLQGDLIQPLSSVKWPQGLSGGISLYRGRTNYRLGAVVFSSRSHALRTDAAGVVQRRDVSFAGTTISLGLTSELIPIGDLGAFCVGATFNSTNLVTATAEVPDSAYDADAALEVTSNQWKPGFLIHAPFRLKIGEQVRLAAEPYYQVFFTPGDFTGFSQQINGATARDGRLKGDIDHLGFNFSLTVLVRR